MAQDDSEAEVVAALAERHARANAAFMRGDIRGYFALVRLADDFTLMAPFGGPPSRGFDMSEERLDAMSRYFQAGQTGLELVQGHVSGDLAMLVVIERQRAEVGGLPAQDWSLRVTLVYRREGGEWRLLHRHADPLVPGITLEQAAAMARG